MERYTGPTHRKTCLHFTPIWMDSRRVLYELFVFVFSHHEDDHVLRRLVTETARSVFNLKPRTSLDNPIQQPRAVLTGKHGLPFCQTAIDDTILCFLSSSQTLHHECLQPWMETVSLLHHVTAQDAREDNALRMLLPTYQTTCPGKISARTPTWMPNDALPCIEADFASQDLLPLKWDPAHNSCLCELENPLAPP
jgi:hypothetical protein